jgi:hypothetical protein
MATYSGDWVDCWLKRNGSAMLAVRLQSLQKPRSLLVRLNGLWLWPYHHQMVQRMRIVEGRLTNGAPEARGVCFLRKEVWAGVVVRAVEVERTSGFKLQG